MNEAVALAVLAGVFWSLNPPVIKRFSGDVDPVVVNGARGLYAILVLAPFIMLYHAGIPGFDGLLFIGFSALLGPFLGDIFYIRAIMSIGGGNAITVGYLYIFVAQLAGFVVFGESPGLRLLLGSILAFTGVYIVHHSNSGSKPYSIGLLYGLLTAVLWGLSTVFSKIATMHGDPVFLGFARNVFLLLATVLARGYMPLRYAFTRNGLVTGFITGGLSFGAGMVFFITALSIGGVSLTVLPTIIAPVLARFFSWLIAGEQLDLRTIIGTLVTVSGILLGSLG